MKFLVATNNAHKLVEIRKIMSELNIEVISLKESGIQIEVEENGNTFEENSFIKSETVCKLSGFPTIADDSGITVEALGGEPGIYSARYGGKATDEERTAYLLSKMVGKENRNAKFVCCITCSFPNGDKISATGEVCGVVTDKPMGENGFGYDPIFYVEEYKQTMAEMPSDTKNKISHRAKALEKFAEKIKEYLGEK